MAKKQSQGEESADFKPSFKHGLKRQEEQPGFNSNFLTKENMRWFNTIALPWLPDPLKPLVLLPCGSAAKTREKYGKKMISHSVGHQLMSAVTTDDRFERVILSEPLTIIPYQLEGQHPDYNLPPKDLSIQSERIFINQLGLWLSRVKVSQPERTFIYYLGPIHHYFILYFANEAAGRPFHIVHEVPPRGTAYYSRAADKFKQVILTTGATHTAPDQAPVSLTKLVSGRGRYTHRAFWREILLERRVGSEYKEYSEPVIAREEAEAGFANLYQNNEIKP